MPVLLGPLHSGFDGLKFGQNIRVDAKSDASRDAGLSADQALAFEGEHHLVDGRRRDGEEALHVGFGGRSSHDKRVGVNEGQILTLLLGEVRFWSRGIHAT
jgi:hypothetical protein